MSDDSAIANLAVDLNEEAKAKRLLKPSFSATSIGPGTDPAPVDQPEQCDYEGDVAPRDPQHNQTWKRTGDGAVFWWHDDARLWKRQPSDVGVDVGPERDSAGVAYDPDQHSPTKSKNRDGTWRAKSKPRGQSAATPVPETPKEGETMSEAEAEDIEIETNDEIEIEIDPKHFIPSIRDALLEQFKHRPKPWSAMSEAEQRDCAAGLEDFSTSLVRRLVEELAAGPRRSIRCLLESYTEKDGIKLAMKVQAFGENESENAVLFLHKARGKNVVVQLASIEDLKGNKQPEIEPDQPEIDWDAPAPRAHPEDDSDLAGDAEEQGGEEGETGGEAAAKTSIVDELIEEAEEFSEDEWGAEGAED